MSSVLPKRQPTKKRATQQRRRKGAQFCQSLELRRTIHKGTINAQQLVDKARAGRRAADGIFSDCKRKCAPSMQPEDQISHPAPGFSLSPLKLEQDRANGAGLSGQGMLRRRPDQSGDDLSRTHGHRISSPVALLKRPFARTTTYLGSSCLSHSGATSALSV
jgi:hypothetical protein